MERETEKISIPFIDRDYSRELFGDFDENVKLIEKTFNVNIVSREDEVQVIGDKSSAVIVEKLIKRLIQIIKKQGKLTKQEVLYTIQLVTEGQEEKVLELLDDTICITATGKTLKPKTLGQKRYVNAIRQNDIVFGIGPAGTGKTYLAMAMAVTAFKNKKVDRIILTRPAVEAGESLGFLPGDLKEKVDPYLRPLYDALFDILGTETYSKYIERGLIEVAPLAYMRGRTLDSSFIILDEAQNTTNEQMKMFLTRLGFGSKAIVTGDITQIDLPRGKTSGLKNIQNILGNVDGIEFIHLDKRDVVRHQLVQRIIEAYEKHEKRETKNKK
ncbi:phosphate starvation inducible protein, PhoH-like protein [Gottschalkia acidurici 9a]|uniref:PhoH-like protein n=1 Tax=Gottschalkia acidurici (strain ATCC 7906 / DSM 604 / BCRC 14475 / CIP 104303 / KCTC 5404 / NCIMB 10678 / 9a) TaxID=1128398 RepID=K0AZW6_GOTA9|nr:PhoH family protein [Gottschalkia acidurici]AFS78824.1 phosphate starvation inducible protein, PhoH-like protein [Gottschalkia acidurici 9a]